MEIRNRRAFVSGAVFLVVALVYLILAWPLDAGTSARMGPGYFPRMLGFLLILLAVVIMANAIRPGAAVEHLEKWNLRALGWITGSILLFAVLLDLTGFVIALVSLLLVASRASHEFTWRGALVSIVVMTVFAVAAFYYGLGLQFSLWPDFI